MDDLLPVGAVYHLSDKPFRRRKHPIGFQTGGDDVTTYRERLKAGVYDAEPKKKPIAKKPVAKKKTPKK